MYIYVLPCLHTYVYMYMYIYIYIYIYVYPHTDMYIHPYMHIHTLYVQNKILYKFYAYDAPYICFTSFHTLRHAYDTFSYTDVTFSQATLFLLFFTYSIHDVCHRKCEQMPTVSQTH